LALSRLDKAPEVFQIISKNVTASKNEIREVVIFVADDKRILINSHFVGKKAAFTYPSHHYKQMVTQLAKFVETYNAKSNGSIIAMNH